MKMDEQSGKGNPEELTEQSGDTTEDEVSGYGMRPGPTFPPKKGATGAGLKTGGKTSSGGGIGGSITLGGGTGAQTVDPVSDPAQAQIDPEAEEKQKYANPGTSSH
jgi:hypothetical protein